ncbi:MarR family winged helix-turn-helix transcriptional regulator [Stenotrophomonas rhizophila]|uniref:MarR family winged helix-turn-helix transcriptional regulator n=1 Tax=Stenotrophomonas TaxID=40323 RepID=UPI00131848B5|nr:MarR family transcriptional regulator [Stenotrophomonas sp. 364]QHB72935.1 MarR family transcriptional regulator [Stenotrophomonas sp. 364]
MLALKHQAFLAEMQRRGQPEPDGLAQCFQLLSLASAIDQDCAQRLAPLGLSEGRFVLLFLLQGAEAPLSPHQLAERAGVTRATVTGLLDGLERDRLLERHADPDDKRRINVRLTTAGEALALTLFDQHTQWIRDLFADLNEAERTLLSGMLCRIWARTDAGRTA